MMHGREKSDLAIVAMKSPNKAGEPAAEAMERRAGAEENAIQQRTRRAQNRESVSQALERVRNVNRRAKGPPYRRPIGSLVLRCWKGGIGRAETELWVSGPPERPATSLAEAGHLSTAVASGAGALRVKRGS